VRRSFPSVVFKKKRKKEKKKKESKRRGAMTKMRYYTIACRALAGIPSLTHMP
jgi:hypothetical protein